jgi:hypothetical protein
MTSAGRQSRTSGTVGLIALALCLLVPITWGIAPQSPWDVDNIAPGQVLKAMAQHFGPTWSSSYGPVPYLLTALVYAPLLLFFRAIGELGSPSGVYPWGFANPGFSVAALSIAARLVTFFLAIQLVLAAARRESSQPSPAPAWAIPLLALGSPTFCYYARTSNVDIHYLFWLWIAFHLIETPAASVRRLAAGAACAALAVCCKEQAAPFAVVACCAALVRAYGRGRPATVSLRSAAFVAAAPVLAYVIAWGLPFHAPGWLAHHHFIFEQAKYPRTYPLTPRGVFDLALNVLRILPVTFGPLLLAAIATAVVLRSSWRGLEVRALACAIYLVAFIATIGYVYPRFLLPLLLLLLPLGARGLRDLAVRFRAAPARAWLTGVATVLALAGGPALSVAMLTDPRLALERWLHAHARPDARIEIAGNPAFQARVAPGANAEHVRADSIAAAPRGPRGDLVLLSSGDWYTFRRDSVVRALWWDSLHVAPPSGRYREITFRPGAAARFVRGLPVAPIVSVFVREGPGSR